MKFSISLESGIHITTDLPSKSLRGADCFFTGFSEEKILEILEAYHKSTLAEYLHSSHQENFLLIFIENDKCTVVNDKFGSNEIFYSSDCKKISNDISLVRSEKSEYDTNALYELFVFFTISPPRTVFADVRAIEMATINTFSSNELKSFQYWNVEKLLLQKNYKYSDHVKNIQNCFEEVLSGHKKDTIGVALSGGIDSGALLGMLSKKYGSGIPSISFGGHGKDTPDLESSRKTADECSSPNVEIYPSFENLKLLPDFFQGLHQPVIADLLLPNSLIFKEAKRQNIQTVFFGFGAEMLLGNLKISKVYSKLRYVDWLPWLIKKPLYVGVASVAQLSKNQKDFLLQRSWESRFLIARGPLFTREKHLYKKIPKDFISDLADDLHKKIQFVKKVTQFDRFVAMYLFGWVNYLQLRDFYAMARKFSIKPFSPFDTPKIAEELFKTPTIFRRKNNWNKQVLRDVSKPFVSDRLYTREVRSLIVPYTKFFKGSEDLFFEYLRQSALLNQLADIESFQRQYEKMPEPGLTLIRWVGLALWDDVFNNREEKIKFFRTQCENAISLQEGISQPT